MSKKKLKAVHDDDLIAFLEEVGVLDSLKAGRTTCKCCGEPLSIETLEALYPEHGEIRFVCSKPSCLFQLAEERFNP